MTKTTTILMLQQYPFLRSIPQEQLEAATDLMRLPVGTVVFDENQVCPGFPLILAGNVRVYKAAQNGRELQLYRAGPGDSCILSSGCLLGNTNYQARGVVEEEVEMLVLPADVFRDLLAAHESFRDYIFNMFAERMNELMQLISAVAFQKVDQRLASLLVSKTSPINSTHQALADELGSVREIISRLLKNFAEQGWVRLGREQVEVTDADALKRFAAL